jgi:iron complex transport system substrate-binding protein
LARNSSLTAPRQRLAAPLLLLLAACGAPADTTSEIAADQAVSALDDTGRAVLLARPATRVVSLLPAGSETLVALGALDLLVGRTRYDVAPELAHLPSVGGGLDPSLESLVALEPDLVIAWDSPGDGRLRKTLEGVGIPVFSIATRDTAAIFRNIRDLGHLTGRDAEADSLARAVRARLETVRDDVPAARRPTVLYVVSIDPPMIAGTDNFLAELIEVAGGRPLEVSGEFGGRSPQLSLEELVRMQPDGIVLPIGLDPGASVGRLHREPGWRDLRAVREGRIATVPEALVNRPGPNIGETAAILRREFRRWEKP